MHSSAFSSLDSLWLFQHLPLRSMHSQAICRLRPIRRQGMRSSSRWAMLRRQATPNRPTHPHRPSPPSAEAFWQCLSLASIFQLVRAPDSFDPGLRLGSLLGGHVAPSISLNGELTIDIFNPKNVPSGYDVTAVAVDLAFSPLYHVANGGIEIVLGPKIGGFGYSASIKDSSGNSMDGSARGVSYGFNLGVFGEVGNLAVGGLVGYTGRHATRACTTLYGSETCDDSPSGDDLKLLSITGAVLF